jgi:predicted kinase
MTGSKTLYIMRGLPGSGKSAVAEALAFGNVYAADDYPGLYGDNMSFNPSLLGKAHENVKNKIIEAMDRGEEKIALANTNTQHWEMAPYVKAAQERGYYVTFVHVEGTISPKGEMTKNIHGVPSEALGRMRSRFEPFDFERRLEERKPFMPSSPKIEDDQKKTKAFELGWYKEAKKKKEYDPNPWAVCTTSVGREDKKKYERCVKKVKKKSK